MSPAVAMVVGQVGRRARMGMGARTGGRRLIAGEGENGMRMQCGGGKGAEGAEGYVVGEVGREAGVGGGCLFAHFW